MGVIKRGILGGFSGRVANVVGGSWKGIAYMRSLPLSVANPDTAAQQAQRGAFGQSVAVAQQLLVGIIKPLWDRFAERMSGYNAWIQANIAQFDANGLATPADVVMSRGNLLGEAIFDITATAGTNLLGMTWNDSSGTGNALATDEAYLVGYNETKDIWGFTAANVTRQDLGDDVDLTNIESGDVCHGWLMFRRPDGTIVSDSSYDTDTAA